MTPKTTDLSHLSPAARGGGVDSRFGCVVRLLPEFRQLSFCTAIDQRTEFSHLPRIEHTHDRIRQVGLLPPRFPTCHLVHWIVVLIPAAGLAASMRSSSRSSRSFCLPVAMCVLSASLGAMVETGHSALSGAVWLKRPVLLCFRCQFPRSSHQVPA